MFVIFLIKKISKRRSSVYYKIHISVNLKVSNCDEYQKFGWNYNFITNFYINLIRFDTCKKNGDRQNFFFQIVDHKRRKLYSSFKKYVKFLKKISSDKNKVEGWKIFFWEILRDKRKMFLLCSLGEIRVVTGTQLSCHIIKQLGL